VLDAPVDRVWEAIKDAERWPEWWRGVERAEQLSPGDADGVGSEWRYVWRSRIPYPVEFETTTTRVERPHLIEAEARGGLAGVGVWRFFEGRGTAVAYEWNVTTTKRWMNAVAPLGRPLFEWNHEVIMRWGAEGLARHLGVPLLARS
jgi:hypothetical protein